MARILGAGEGLRGMGHLWTWAVRDSQGRRGRWSSFSMGQGLAENWHGIGIHIVLYRDIVFEKIKIPTVFVTPTTES